MSMTCFYTKDMSRWIPWVTFWCPLLYYWCRHIHACMTIYPIRLQSRGNKMKFILSIWRKLSNCYLQLSSFIENKKKISYEAIELHCLKHNSPKTGWTKYNIFLSVIWKEYALARMNKVRHACSRKSKHEYYFMNSMNELLWSMTWIYNDLS